MGILGIKHEKKKRKEIQFPHCDSRVLHAPDECQYCDEHSDWQEVRQMWGINFTGQKDPNKLPCPSEMQRDIKMINRWYGNRAEKKRDLTPNEVMAKLTGEWCLTCDKIMDKDKIKLHNEMAHSVYRL